MASVKDTVTEKAVRGCVAVTVLQQVTLLSCHGGLLAKYYREGCWRLCCSDGVAA